jgi:hypothetical protein
MTPHRAALILLFINAALLVANTYASTRVAKDWLLNVRIAAANREVTEMLPPHPCRSVILPGERCSTTMMFKLPREPGI